MPKLINPIVLLKKSWALYCQKFGILVSLLAVPFLLFTISPLLAQTEDFLYLPFSLLLLALAFFAIWWAGTAVVIVLRDREETLTIKEALARSWGKLLPVLWVGLIVGAIAGGASMLFLIPGLIFGVYFIFAKLIAVVEKEKGMNALIKSREYVRDYFWPVVGRYLLIVAVTSFGYFVLSFVASLPSKIFLTAWNAEVGTAVFLILQVVVHALISPLALVAMYLLYTDVRRVKADLVLEKNNKSGLFYLLVDLGGWLFLGVMIVLATVVLTSAVGGYVLGAFVSDIFNNQALLPMTETLLK